MSTITPASGIGSGSIYDFQNIFEGKSGSIYDFQNTFEIPGYCTKLAILLAEQPLFDGRRGGGLAKRSKVISLNNEDNARICAIFNTNARQILGKRRAWQIRDIVPSDQVHDLGDKEIHQGLSLGLYDTVTPCPVEELEKAYNQVLEKLTLGWKSAKTEEDPDISNPDDFYMFVKERALSDEGTLIRLLARKFSMEENVKKGSNPKWVAHSGCKDNNKIYLWIKKTAFEDIVNKFGFKMDKPHS